MGIGFLGLGMTPTWSRAETPVMPKSRYKIMTNYMPKVGSRGLDMMFRTCTVQANLDFCSEADMVQKLRVSLALQPVATALFANSPFTEGRPNGFLSSRSEIWRDTDNERAGMLPWAFEDGMGFERYVDYALEVPMYFVKRGAIYHDVAGSRFPRSSGRQAAATAGRVGHHVGLGQSSVDDLSGGSAQALSRNARRGRRERGAYDVLSAFWVGLLYDDVRSMPAWDIVKSWTAVDRQTFRDDVPRFGLRPRCAASTVFEIATEVLKLSRAGLVGRKRLNPASEDETRYLGVLEERLLRGSTPAQDLLAKFSGPWHGSVDPIFTEDAY